MDNEQAENPPPISNILLQNSALSSYNFRIFKTAFLRYSR